MASRSRGRDRGRIEPLTYYVATNETGANNSNNGRYPTFHGGADGPFKDFTSTAITALLSSAANLRLVVRAGTYDFSHVPFATTGLVINGVGTSSQQMAILENYPNEAPVLDGAANTREVVRTSGNYVRVSGVTVANSGGYAMEVRGSSHVTVRGCSFTAPSTTGSDTLKIDDSQDVDVDSCDFTAWLSQGIDITRSTSVTVHQCRFHDSSTNIGLGMKVGCNDVRIIDNTFDNCWRAINVGGVSSTHAASYEVTNVLVSSNTASSLGQYAVQFYACSSVVVDRNTFSGAGGFRFGEIVDGPSGCQGGAGCLASRKIAITNNHVTSTGNAFWAVYKSTPFSSMTASGNRYCHATPNFAYGDPLTTTNALGAWQTWFGSDGDAVGGAC